MPASSGRRVSVGPAVIGTPRYPLRAWVNRERGQGRAQPAKQPRDRWEAGTRSEELAAAEEAVAEAGAKLRERDVNVSEAIVRAFFFSSRRRHTRLQGDWSSDVCSSD